MSLHITAMTVEQFDVWIMRQDNADRLFEFIGGEVYEVPSNAYASQFSQIIAGELYAYLRGKDLAHLTGEAGGYMVSGERYAPDVGLIFKAKQPVLARSGYNPNPPDLAVEVDFPSTYQTQKMLRTKIINYLAAGTVVWLVSPETRTVSLYAPGQPARTLSIEDTLDGAPLLPGFILPLKTIFAEDED
jgi:Uma2 family endonuclease